MTKTSIPTIAGKNRITGNIIDALDKRKSFLILGHKSPDEDCIASMVSFALLVTKFEKEAYICTEKDIHEHFAYLLDICKYNSIHITDHCEENPPPVDTLVVCDTPKPHMIFMSEPIRELAKDPSLVKIEIDHHLEADSAYWGDPEYSLVDEASSASELVGYTALKLSVREELIEKYHITDLFSRNMVLAILTGIIGDSKMGKYLKTKKEKRYYRMFSSMFNELLQVATYTKAADYYSNKEEVFEALGRLSNSEAGCFTYFIEKKKATEHICYVLLDKNDSDLLHRTFDIDTVISVSRSIADVLAEESGFISLVVFYDRIDKSDLVQFRMRRSQAFTSYDLRKILTVFDIDNGGGHEGAIGFRIPRDQVNDITEYTVELLEGVEKTINWNAKR